MKLTNRELWNAGLAWGGDPTLMGARKPRERTERKVERGCATEWQEQAALVTWWWRYSETRQMDTRLLFSIPNGAVLHGDGNARAIQASRLKSSGMRVGVPDLMLAISKGEYHGLFIEVKAKDGGVSPDQRDYHDLLMQRGYKVNVCYGAEAGIEIIKQYLSARDS